jgi:hypothetical protein
MKDDLKNMKRERNDFRDKFDQAKEDLELFKRERDDLRKKHARANEDLEHMQRELDKRPNDKPTGRSSPMSKYNEEPRGGFISALVTGPRPQSPRADSRVARPTNTPPRRGSSSSDEFPIGYNK